MASDGQSRAQAKATTLIDDARVRVTRFDFAPGAETGWHRHAMDYVITTLSECNMLLEEPGGASRSVTMPPEPSTAVTRASSTMWSTRAPRRCPSSKPN